MSFTVLLITVLVVILISCHHWIKRNSVHGAQKIPVSVNYHFTRECNYSCGFCFHTAKTSHVESVENAKRGLLMLKQAGMRKMNFAGGEPFVKPKMLGELAKYCKEELHLESVSVVTNGSKVTEGWLSEYGKYLDIMAVSCDSFNEDTNVKIGRGKGFHLAHFEKLCQTCKEQGIKFKVNTVVNRYNFDEDMNEPIKRIAPFRWKCFQVLIVEGENDCNQTLRDAREFAISDEEFNRFCQAHSHNRCFVPEGNNVMRSSYLLLDEYMRFLNKGVGDPTKSILDVGVPAALANVYWDEEGFNERGGVYDWTRSSDCNPEAPPKLDW